MRSTMVLCAVLVACSSEARPPPASEGAPTNEERSQLVAPDTCEPKAQRLCRFTYIDQSGDVQCPTRTQHCSAAGRWLACGQIPDETTEP